MNPNATPTGTLNNPHQQQQPSQVEVDNDDTIRLYIPREYYLVPLSTTSAGLALGFLRGTRQTSLQFLAENAHRPPKTVEEWYFYHKSKNYRVLFGGLKASGREGARLGAAGLAWVGLEQAAKEVGHGVEEWREVVAGVGLAGLVSLICSYEVCFAYEWALIHNHALRSTATEDECSGFVVGVDWW